jgi:precorrin-6B methylase 1
MSRKVPGKKMKKVIQKQELSQVLRPFEKKLFEKYKKEKDNKMVRVLALGSSMFTLLKKWWALKFCSCEVWRSGGGDSCCRT